MMPLAERTEPSPERDTLHSSELEVSPDAPVVLDQRYELSQLLGAGGMGLVYAARHTVLGTRLAVKILRGGQGGHDVELMERFVREAQAASAIGHRGIVDVRDFGVTADGRAYFVMERLDGHDLSDELARCIALPVDRAVRIALQVCAAVGAAHQHGIVHRDLKPENVFLLTGDPEPDRVKVLDFGVAKFAERPDARTDTASVLARRLTAFGEVLGTPVYMSPEQCGGEGVDARSDVYALGVMLYEMVTSVLPFDAPTPLETMRLHRQEAPLSPRELVPTLPDALVDVILRCLEKSPAARFQSMAELAAALEPLGERRVSTPRSFQRPASASEAVPAPRAARAPEPVTVTATVPVLLARPSRLGIGLAIAAGLVALFGLVFGSVWWLTRGEAAVATAPPPVQAPVVSAPPPVELEATPVAAPVAADQRAVVLAPPSPVEPPRPARVPLRAAAARVEPMAEPVAAPPPLPPREEGVSDVGAQFIDPWAD